MLRGYREEDRRAVARLAAGALDGSVEGWEEHYDQDKNPRLDPKQVYVVEEDGEIRAMAAVLPLEVFVDGEPVPMGGIADVATHAAYRRRGYAGDLMRTALAGMRERRVHLSMLHPFAHSFYQPLRMGTRHRSDKLSPQTRGPAYQRRAEARPGLPGG